MNILCVSNLYPPEFIGGYELGCRDVVEGLRRRGHTVHILAGDYRTNATPVKTQEDGVERLLRFDNDSRGARHHWQECRKLRRTLMRLRPDLVYFWNQQGLSRWLPLAAHWSGFRTAFFLFDASFAAWRVGALLRRAAQRSSLIRRWFGATSLVQGWPVLRHRPCHFGSEFLREIANEANLGFDADRSAVIRWGINANEFMTQASTRERWPAKQLLYVGQISPFKGIHTAIKAMAVLAQQGLDDLRFTIVGGGTNLQYEQQLRESAQSLGLANRIDFRGKVERSKLAPIFDESDVLLFPSEWDEPFGITRIEAMAAGLVVIGTTTGGSGGLLRNHETAFTFEAANSVDCARALHEACKDRDLFERVRLSGQREVLTKYTLEGMLTQIESSLALVVQ